MPWPPSYDPSRAPALKVSDECRYGVARMGISIATCGILVKNGFVDRSQVEELMSVAECGLWLIPGIGRARAREISEAIRLSYD